MNKQQRDIPFFLWLQAYLSSSKRKAEVNATQKTSIKWNTSTKGVMKTNHPPLEPLTYGKKNIQAIPLVPSDSKNDDTYATKEIVSKVHEQQNYSNLILKTINNQTEKIETVLNSIKSVIITKQNPLLKPPAEKLIIIPNHIPTNVQLSNKHIHISDEFAAHLSLRLNSFNLKDTIEKGKEKVSSFRFDRSPHNIEASSSKTSSTIDDSERVQLNSLVKPELQKAYYHRQPQLIFFMKKALN